MLRALSSALIALLALASGTSGPGGPTPVDFVPGTAAFFRADGHTHADYLLLARTGRYEITGVEHMGRLALDRGRWRTEGSRLFLVSETRLLDLVSPPYRVDIFNPGDADLLPDLKAAVLALHARLNAAPVTPAVVSELVVADYSGSQKRALHVSMDPEIEFGVGTAPASSLLRFAKAIDRYIAQRRSQNVLPLRAYTYRGHTFLVPLDPGVSPILSTPSSVQADLDKAEGGAPHYVYLLVPQADFERGVGTTYPFHSAPPAARQER